MPATITLPVFVRVGDGDEVQVGTVTAEVEFLLDEQPAAEGAAS
jgi:hypothetical protein